MNRDRRKTLSEAISLLNDAQGKVSEAKDIVEMAAVEERDAFDNLSEGFQCNEKGMDMEENADALDDVTGELESIYDEIQVQIDAVQEIIAK